MAVDDWDRRLLCPDDGCIGVIGPGGTCKVCGRAAPNWGDERNRGLTPLPSESPTESDSETGSEPDSDPDADSDSDGEPGSEPESEPDDAPSAPPDWQERRLCIDDACIGLVGPDGACKVCGKRADAGAA